MQNIWYTDYKIEFQSMYIYVCVCVSIGILDTNIICLYNVTLLYITMYVFTPK